MDAKMLDGKVAIVLEQALANKAEEQPGGAKMLEYSNHFVYFPGPECDPMDQANALPEEIGKIGERVLVVYGWCKEVY